MNMLSNVLYSVGSGLGIMGTVAVGVGALAAFILTPPAIAYRRWPSERQLQADRKGRMLGMVLMAVGCGLWLLAALFGWLAKLLG